MPYLVVGAAGMIEDSAVADAVGSKLALPVDSDGAVDALPPGSLDGPHLTLRRQKTEQAHVCLGVRALSYMHPDRYTLDLLNTVLGEGMSARLFLNIRERLGLAYDVHSFTQKHRDTGYLGVYLGVDPKNALKAVEAAMSELQRLRDQDVEPEEIARAKEFTKGRLRLDLETTNGVAFWLTYQQLVMGSVRTIEDELAQVDAVTAADIRRVANDVLSGPMQMAVIGPFAKSASFRALL
jgi:predicted Zn-dependent peptidase